MTTDPASIDADGVAVTLSLDEWKDVIAAILSDGRERNTKQAHYDADEAIVAKISAQLPTDR